MIIVLHGENEYARSLALSRIRESAGPEEVRDPNTTVFEGAKFGLNDVIGAAQVVPFMADRRVVIVYGILARMQRRDKSLGDDWRELTERLAQIPSTTELVFVEDVSLRDNGLAIKSVGPSARIQHYRILRGPELETWVRDRFAYYGAQVTRDAVARIAWLAGSDIRLLDQEIQKLALYTADREVTRSDVEMMVQESRQVNIFSTIDAILERRPAVAMKQLYSLLSDGISVQNIITMLARQVRLLILAIELRHQGIDQEEIGNRIGLTNRYALEKTIRQSHSFGGDQLANIMRRLLATDLMVKRGKMSDRLAVEILVGELSAT